MDLIKENETEILFEDRYNARYIVLNNPKKLNIFWSNIPKSILEHLKQWENDNSQKLIIFKSSSERVFCAGANITRLLNLLEKEGADISEGEHVVDLYYQMVNFLSKMKTPIVSVLNGITMGGGAMIPAVSPFRIATETTVFAMPETRIGSFVDAGASYVLSRMDRNLGVYLALTGTSLKAEDVLYSGLATHFVKSFEVSVILEELNQLENPTLEKINDILESYSVSIDHKSKSYTLHGQKMQTIECCFKYNTVEEILQALDRDGSDFALQSKAQILEKSPTSLKITLENIRRGSNCSYTDCLKTERGLWKIVPYTREFKEGGTALLIEKRKPKWNPSRIEDVSLETIIQNYFDEADRLKASFEDLWNGTCKHPFNAYILPHKDEILKKSRELNGDNIKTLAWFTNKYNKKYGVEQKVMDILAITNKKCNELLAKL